MIRRKISPPRGGAESPMPIGHGGRGGGGGHHASFDSPASAVAVEKGQRRYSGVRTRMFIIPVPVSGAVPVSCITSVL